VSRANFGQVAPLSVPVEDDSEAFTSIAPLSVLIWEVCLFPIGHICLCQMIAVFVHCMNIDDLVSCMGQKRLSRNLAMSRASHSLSQVAQCADDLPSRVVGSGEGLVGAASHRGAYQRHAQLGDGVQEVCAGFQDTNLLRYAAGAESKAAGLE
jgi:hypothetical protein